MRLNRRDILTAVVVLSSCILSFGGFFVMQELLAQKERVILSQTDTFPVIVDNGMESDDTPKTELSQEELWQVLKSMEGTASEELHEPFGRQISMKEAIERGKIWIKDFCAGFTDIEEEQFEAYEKITAVLYKKDPAMGSSAISDELCSYWQVEYIMEHMEIHLCLNAVTGQALQVKIRLADQKTDDIHIEELLKFYGETFSLNLESGVKRNNNLNYLSTENGIYVVFSEADFKISEQRETVRLNQSGTIWNLYLSTELKN